MFLYVLHAAWSISFAQTIWNPAWRKPKQMPPIFYGLPALRKELRGEVELPPATKEIEVFTQEGAPREFCKLLIQLLKEVNLNATINKSMLSSIFNACADDFGKSFAEGCYACTPDYLEDFELKGLKSLGK